MARLQLAAVKQEVRMLKEVALTMTLALVTAVGLVVRVLTEGEER